MLVKPQREGQLRLLNLLPRMEDLENFVTCQEFSTWPKAMKKPSKGP